MAFGRLVGDPQGEIILVNLHEMSSKLVLPRPLVESSLTQISTALAGCDPSAGREQLRRSAQNAIFQSAANFQVRGAERPALDVRISAILGFDKVLALLSYLSQRRPDDDLLEAALRSLNDPTADARTIAGAADVLNGLKDRNLDLTLTNVRTIFWAAPSEDVDNSIADKLISLGGTWLPAEIATHLRDALGLGHLEPFWRGRAQHLFLFRSREPLSEIAKDVDFACSRPTAVDGIDNPRFSQALRHPPRLAGCGLTVDLTGGVFGPGLPELVLTPLSMAHFDCRYIGEVAHAASGSHEDFLNVLAPGAVFTDLAADLASHAGGAGAP